jgi:hypothetical protein
MEILGFAKDSAAWKHRTRGLSCQLTFMRIGGMLRCVCSSGDRLASWSPVVAGSSTGTSASSVVPDVVRARLLVPVLPELRRGSLRLDGLPSNVLARIAVFAGPQSASRMIQTSEYVSKAACHESRVWKPLLELCGTKCDRLKLVANLMANPPQLPVWTDHHRHMPVLQPLLDQCSQDSAGERPLYRTAVAVLFLNRLQRPIPVAVRYPVATGQGYAPFWRHRVAVYPQSPVAPGWDTTGMSRAMREALG